MLFPSTGSRFNLRASLKKDNSFKRLDSAELQESRLKTSSNDLTPLSGIDFDEMLECILLKSQDVPLLLDILMFPVTLPGARVTEISGS